jgi:hypothetical protein
MDMPSDPRPADIFQAAQRVKPFLGMPIRSYQGWV